LPVEFSTADSSTKHSAIIVNPSFFEVLEQKIGKTLAACVWLVFLCQFLELGPEASDERNHCAGSHMLVALDNLHCQLEWLQHRFDVIDVGPIIAGHFINTL